MITPDSRLCVIVAPIIHSKSVGARSSASSNISSGRKGLLDIFGFDIGRYIVYANGVPAAEFIELKFVFGNDKKYLK